MRWNTLQTWRVFDLSHEIDSDSPFSPNQPGYRMSLLRRHGDYKRPDGGSSATELIVMGGHTGTHLDALCHISRDDKMFGGVSASDSQTGGRFTSLGVHTVRPIVTRGVLLDVAASLGVPGLNPAQRISGSLLAEVAAEQQTPVRPGDAVFIRSGWAAKWGAPNEYLGHEQGVPGPDVSAARWLAEQEIVVAGHDSMAFEWLAPGAGHSSLPVHSLLLVEKGIHIIENLFLEELSAARAYEFLVFAAPLKFVGATGSPIRPVALVPPPDDAAVPAI